MIDAIKVFISKFYRYMTPGREPTSLGVSWKGRLLYQDRMMDGRRGMGIMKTFGQREHIVCCYFVFFLNKSKYIRLDIRVE